MSKNLSLLLAEGAIVLAGFVVSAKTADAAPAAHILIQPATGTFITDSTFDVSIFLDTVGFSINAIDLTIQFPADKLQVVNPSAGNSFINLWLQQPYVSNEKGLLHLAGGVTGNGINTSSGLITTITFRARAPGNAVIKISNDSMASLGDGQGTQIQLTLGRASYQIVQKPSAGPKVFSPSHPNPDSWSRINNIMMGWEKEDQAVAYSYTFSKDPTEIPDNIDDTASTSAGFAGVADGIWYFHIKQKKGGMYGEPTHFQVKIDTTPPAAFEPQLEFLSHTSTRAALLTFFTTDVLSGLDHYTVALFDQTKQDDAEPMYIEASSPYRLQDLGSHVHILVRAFDKAGNFRDGMFDTGESSNLAGLVKENLPWIGLGAMILFVLSIFLKRRHDYHLVLAPNPNATVSRQNFKEE